MLCGAYGKRSCVLFSIRSRQTASAAGSIKDLAGVAVVTVKVEDMKEALPAPRPSCLGR